MSKGRRWAALAANDLTKALSNIVEGLSYSDDGLCEMHVRNARAHLDEAHKKIMRAEVELDEAERPSND